MFLLQGLGSLLVVEQLGQELIGALGLETGRWLHIHKRYCDTQVAELWIYFWLAVALCQLLALKFYCDPDELMPKSGSFAGGYECISSTWVSLT